SLVDLDFDPRQPAASTLVVRTTCSNRDLARQLQRAGEQLHLELEAAAPLAGIRCVRTPTTPLRPPRRRGAYWRLISHLSLNHLSLTPQVERWELLTRSDRDSCEREGREALKEILRLYDFSDPNAGQQLEQVNRQLIDGIQAIHYR